MTPSSYGRIAATTYAGPGREGYRALRPGHPLPAAERPPTDPDRPEPIGDLTADEAAALFELGMMLERLARGLPTKIVRVRGDVSAIAELAVAHSRGRSA